MKTIAKPCTSAIICLLPCYSKIRPPADYVIEGQLIKERYVDLREKGNDLNHVLAMLLLFVPQCGDLGEELKDFTK